MFFAIFLKKFNFNALSIIWPTSSSTTSRKFWKFWNIWPKWFKKGLFFRRKWEVFREFFEIYWIFFWRYLQKPLKIFGKTASGLLRISGKIFTPFHVIFVERQVAHIHQLYSIQTIYTHNEVKYTQLKLSTYLLCNRREQFFSSRWTAKIEAIFAVSSKFRKGVKFSLNDGWHLLFKFCIPQGMRLYWLENPFDPLHGIRFEGSLEIFLVCSSH